jgi:hypothetical protein
VGDLGQQVTAGGGRQDAALGVGLGVGSHGVRVPLVTDGAVG